MALPPGWTRCAGAGQGADQKARAQMPDSASRAGPRGGPAEVERRPRERRRQVHHRRREGVFPQRLHQCHAVGQARVGGHPRPGHEVVRHLRGVRVQARGQRPGAPGARRGSGRRPQRGGGRARVGASP
ncbi:unnamed protein product, partial [Prorocentrum cordatum]